MLAGLIGEAAPEAAMLDVGANIGDSAALCRLQGLRSRIIAIEGSLTYYKFLQLNRLKRPAVFADVEPVWAMVGTAAGGGLELHDGTARAAPAGLADARFERAPAASLQQIAATHGAPDVGLVKIDTDGQDQAIVLAELDWLRTAAPVLWLETDILARTDEAAWARIFAQGADAWPWLAAFDNFGFAFTAGATAEKAGACLELISYARRHKAAPTAGFGSPKVYYLDVALFPARFEGVFERFRALLPELDL
jgi:FkbM family methyltransferase